MKKTIRYLTSWICVMALILPLVGSASAVKVQEVENEAELIQQMKELNFTQEEIDYLLQLERQRIREYNAISLYAFPKNPQIGDRHTETYRISISTASNIASLTALVLQVGVPLGAAILVVQGIIQYKADNIGVTGVDVSIEYYYGEDNHGGIGWTPGPITIEAY